MPPALWQPLCWPVQCDTAVPGNETPHPGLTDSLWLSEGALRIQRTVRTSVRLTYGEDLQIDWDGHGELLVKVLFLSVLFLPFWPPLVPPKHVKRFSCAK